MDKKYYDYMRKLYLDDSKQKEFSKHIEEDSKHIQDFLTEEEIVKSLKTRYIEIAKSDLGKVLTPKEVCVEISNGEYTIKYCDRVLHSDKQLTEMIALMYSIFDNFPDFESCAKAR